jgi:hypothetical protein
MNATNKGSGFRIQGSGFRVQDSGFRKSERGSAYPILTDLIDIEPIVTFLAKKEI